MNNAAGRMEISPVALLECHQATTEHASPPHGVVTQVVEAILFPRRHIASSIEYKCHIHGLVIGQVFAGPCATSNMSLKTEEVADKMLVCTRNWTASACIWKGRTFYIYSSMEAA
ncbi:hypothetical protein MVEN_00024000 [Mycena venus]|uniref:Uncharacterized protein n=1 Tax=Mycena venus TaxID=2733690 RepID=A0A8H6Z3K7_9AGAR|nr:hypothetical protein MVEN_00024000 [Mycena venus]